MKLGVAWQLVRAARLLVADPEDQLVRKVQSVLDDSLRRPKYKGHENPLTGQCYVASESLYYLLGGKAAGWTPMFISHEGEPHWFLKNADGHILDATASQFRTPVPYEKARGKGFLTLKPSKRAQAVMDRVEGLDKKESSLRFSTMNAATRQPRRIENECMYGGAAVSVSPGDRMTGQVRCPGCGRIVQLRRGGSGFVADRPQHTLPRHSRPA